MTDEELDAARAAEAKILAEAEADERGVARHLILPSWIALTAARLAREGWMPPPAVDPLLLEARNLAAVFHPHRDRSRILSGEYDDWGEVRYRLAGLIRGVEIGRTTAAGWFSIDTAPKDGTRIIGFWFSISGAEEASFIGGRWMTNVNRHLVAPDLWTPCPKVRS